MEEIDYFSNLHLHDDMNTTEYMNSEPQNEKYSKNVVISEAIFLI